MARVYDAYGQTPPHPGPSFTRFVCISDTHARVYDVPPGDVLIHAGDMGNNGYLKNLRLTIEWLKALEHPIKIIIAGNHDLCLDEDWQEGGAYDWTGSAISEEDVREAKDLVSNQDAREAGISYLKNESLSVTMGTGRTWKIYGSPAAPQHSVGAFQYNGKQEAEAIYNRIPDDTEILITHTPAYRILDKTRKGRHAGCPYLLQQLNQLPNRKLHVHGHIHEGRGAVTCTGSDGEEAGVSVNAAMTGEGQAIIVDLPN